MQIQLTIDLPEQYAAQLDKIPNTVISHAVREALDKESKQTQSNNASHEDLPDWKKKILKGAGLWENRNDLPDFDQIRKETTRNFSDK